MFGLQGTSFGVFGSNTRAFISGGSTSSSNLGSFNCLKESLSHALISVWKTSQTLQQHIKNDHKERKNAWQNVKSLVK